MRRPGLLEDGSPALASDCDAAWRVVSEICPWLETIRCSKLIVDA